MVTITRFDKMLIKLRKLQDLNNGHEILNVLDSFEFAESDWQPYLKTSKEKLELVVHKKEGYCKTWLTRHNDPFLVGLYHWKPGSATPIHDHGDFSTAFYKTLKGGNLTNIVYKKVLSANGAIGIKEKRKETLGDEKAVAILPNTEAHIVRNDTGRDVFSIHVYVPGFEHHRIWRSEYDTVRLPNLGPKL